MNDIREAKAIPDGNKISFDKHGEYTIEKVLGYGGSGIVYKGLMEEQQIPVIIKEFFPLALADYIERRDDDENWRLVIQTHVPVVDECGTEVILEKEFNAALDLFKTGCKRHNELYRSDPNRTVTPWKPFEGNGTAYSVMEFKEGISLDKNMEERSLSDVVEIMQSLAKVIESYHAQDYIHLDIKP